MPIRSLLTACATAAMLAATPASAALVSYQMTGTAEVFVISAAATAGFRGLVEAMQGQAVTATFTLNTSVADSNASATVGRYNGAVVTSTMTIGSLTHSTVAYCNFADLPDCSVEVRNNSVVFGPVLEDLFLVRSRNLSPDLDVSALGLDFLNLGFRLSTADVAGGVGPTLLDNTDLAQDLTTLPGLSASMQYIASDQTSATLVVRGLQVTQLTAQEVPEPATWALLGAGLLGLRRWRRS